MSWYPMNIPTDFSTLELPEFVEYENSETEEVVRYVPERTCRFVRSAHSGRRRCSECGDYQVNKSVWERFCHSCGARVVGVDD